MSERSSTLITSLAQNDLVAPVLATLFAFLPTRHIVAIESGRIWAWLEDYADAFADGPRPRNVNLVTGASGTTDIEGALVRGAHCPVG